MLYSSTCQICEIFPLMLYYSILLFFTCITSSRCCVLHELFLRVISLDISQENLFILYISFHVVWHQQHHIHMIPPHSRSNNSNNGWGYKKMEPKFSNGIFKVLHCQRIHLVFSRKLWDWDIHLLHTLNQRFCLPRIAKSLFKTL